MASKDMLEFGSIETWVEIRHASAILRGISFAELLRVCTRNDPAWPSCDNSANLLNLHQVFAAMATFLVACKLVPIQRIEASNGIHVVACLPLLVGTAKSESTQIL